MSINKFQIPGIKDLGELKVGDKVWYDNSPTMSFKGEYKLYTIMYQRSGITFLKTEEEEEIWLPNVCVATKMGIIEPQFFTCEFNPLWSEPTSHSGKVIVINTKEIWIEADKLIEDYPVGTKFQAYGGGYWEKVCSGYKWCTGATFPRPGGDWNGKICLPIEEK